jgi:hypothetical protein
LDSPFALFVAAAVAVRGELKKPGVAAFFREWVCERHPDEPWRHDDCPGPGMPPSYVKRSV